MSGLGKSGLTVFRGSTIKNILRTMQRVLSCFSKDKKPPFSQKGLDIPEKDKLQMKIESRKAVSFSWADSKRIADAIRKLKRLGKTRKNTYATAFTLAAATGLRCGELFALRVDDIDFRAGTIRVDESADQRTFTIGPCKNAAAYRTVVLADPEGREALRMLRQFLGDGPFHRNRLYSTQETGLPYVKRTCCMMACTRLSRLLVFRRPECTPFVMAAIEGGNSPE